MRGYTPMFQSSKSITTCILSYSEQADIVKQMSPKPDNVAYLPVVDYQ